MTTRTRESGLPDKEKRGTSPSNVATTGTPQRRRSPVPSKTNSPARTSDSEKRVPNYLKPTLSSGHDVSKQQGKKPVSTTDSTQNPTLARRRSFDKPPSPSRTQKTRVSPNPTVRSSSFSGKVSTSQKVGSERSLKGSKDVGKQQTLYARPVNTGKKGITGIKKQETGGGGSSISKEKIASPPEKVHDLDIADIQEPEMKAEDQELISIEQVENNSEEGAKDLVLEDLEDQEQGEGVAKDLVLEDQEQGEGIKYSVLEAQEPVNIEQTEAESDENESKIETFERSESDENESKIETFEPSADSEIQDAKIVAIDNNTALEHVDASPGAKTGEQEEKPEVEKLEEVKEQSKNEVNNIDNTDEYVAEIEEVEETKQEQQQQEEEAIEVNKKEEEDEPLEQKAEAENEVEKTQGVENAGPKAQVVAHGKKDSAVSNDVIEETVNKLREQRKNKVKALAGAFETVMSLQEPK